ncbi:MAG: transporter permease [Pseudomonadota bacterium]
MDVWHWTPLVALLAYAGLRSIPEAYYQAVRIDGASKLAVFRYIQLPKILSQYLTQKAVGQAEREGAGHA